MESLDVVIATLNNLEVGALDKIASDLALVRTELEERRLTELVELTGRCREALARGDLAEFRRLRETLVSRLGHVRQKTTS